MKLSPRLVLVLVLGLAAGPLAPLPAGAVPPPAPRLVAAEVPGSGRHFTTGVVGLDKGVDLVGLAYRGATGADVEVRASADGETWGPWVHLGDATSEGPDRRSPERRAGRVTHPAWTGGARFVQYKVDSPDGVVSGLRLQGVDVRGRQESVLAKLGRHLRGVAGGGPEPAGALAGQPAVVSRAQWGADESLRRGNADYGRVRMALVHHTVSANTYSRAEAPGLIRGIYAYHVKANGWDDIGYNFLVDRFGTVYEGRSGGIDRPVIGAHAEGFNSSSTGVALLGTHTSSAPPAAALEAAHRLLAWRLDVAHVDPLATVRVTSRGSDRFPEGTVVDLPAVAGHRDVGVTACPGDLAYRQLAAIRAAVDAIGRPKIYDPRAEPASVEGDLVLGYGPVTIRARATEAVVWTATVVHDGLGEVRHLPPSAGLELVTAWDGRSDLALPLPGGRYRVLIEAVAPGGPVRPAEADVELRQTGVLDPVLRVAGADRYATAAEASQRLAPDGAGRVVLASGLTRHLVDSLVAAPLARAKQAPLLLTGGGGLPAPTAAELDRLKPADAWLVGGTAAVPEATADDLRARGITVHRVAGPDAPSTAAAVAEAVGGVLRGAVVVGRESAHLVDGLAAAGPAAGLNRPVLLVQRGSVPAVTTAALAALGLGEVWAVGGPAAIDDAVVLALRARRVAGADRWATAAAVAEAAVTAGLSRQEMVVASGEDAHLVDALAAGAFGKAVLLTARDALPRATWDVLYRARATTAKAWVMGGTAAVGAAPAADVGTAINAP